MINTLKNLWQQEDGQDLVEYSLLLSFIALAAIGVLTNVSKSISGLWTTVNSSLTNANSVAKSGAS
jgi:Flp pilus assembly pilin Flp